MNLKETGYESVDWTHQTQNWVQHQAFVSMVMNLKVSKGQGIS
jgi:hypothetical protein